MATSEASAKRERRVGPCRAKRVIILMGHSLTGAAQLQGEPQALPIITCKA